NRMHEVVALEENAAASSEGQAAGATGRLIHADSSNTVTTAWRRAPGERRGQSTGLQPTRFDRHHRLHRDRPQPGERNPRVHVDAGVLIPSVDDDESTRPLLGLGEGAIRGGEPAAQREMAARLELAFAGEGFATGGGQIALGRRDPVHGRPGGTVESHLTRLLAEAGERLGILAPVSSMVKNAPPRSNVRGGAREDYPATRYASCPGRIDFSGSLRPCLSSACRILCSARNTRARAPSVEQRRLWPIAA